MLAFFQPSWSLITYRDLSPGSPCLSPAVAAESPPSHGNFFRKVIPANAGPVSGLCAAIGPNHGEGLLSSESWFLTLRVPTSSLTKFKSIISKFTHQ